jgi:tetratricopeptide (TPR) repeat protein
MKNRLTLIVAVLFLGFQFTTAQNADCATQLSLFAESAKAKNYDAAEPYYAKLVTDCPSYSLATYQYGIKMYDHYLDNAPDAEKMKFAQKLIEAHQAKLEHFEDNPRVKKGDVLADIAQVMYDNKVGTTEEQYAAFDKAWDEDRKSFKSPKGLLTYFSLLVDLQEQGKKELQDVFDSYDAVITKIETENNDLATRVTPLIEKQESGEDLSSKEKRLLKNGEIYLKNYSIVTGSINGKFGKLADCDNLIPLYSSQFEEKKSNSDWLRAAAGRMSGKECTDDPLFKQLVEALHANEPSPESAYYLGILEEKAGNNSKAFEYYNESAERQTDPKKKAKVYVKLAENLKSKGSYSSARNYYRKVLEINPSYGRAYLAIAEMYAKSVNNCGNTAFEKRSVYWLAADMAEKAGRVDPSLSSTSSKTAAAYRGRAPQKADIFSEGMAGKTIRIGCWIGASVRVPNV